MAYIALEMIGYRYILSWTGYHSSASLSPLKLPSTYDNEIVQLLGMETLNPRCEGSILHFAARLFIKLRAVEDWHTCFERLGLFGGRGNGNVVGIDDFASSRKALVVVGKGGSH